MGQTHVWETFLSGAMSNADSSHSNLVTTRTSLPRAQIPHLLPCATYRSRPPQGCQDPEKLGLQYWQEKAKDPASLDLFRTDFHATATRPIDITPCTFMHSRLCNNIHM